MKAIIFSAILMLALVTTSCDFYTEERNVVEGETYVAKVFEIKGDFLSKNNWELFYSYPTNFKVYDTDVVLVYLLWETTKDSQGKDLDIWRLLPQTILLKDGVLQYNYDYSKKDVKIFLQGSTDFSKLLPAETLGQVFRVVVVPAEFAKKIGVDTGNLNLMLKTPGLKIEGLSDTSVKVQ